MGRPKRVKRVLLDASALIGVITGESAFECLRSLLAAIDRREVTLVESTAILTEVLHRHARDNATHARTRDSLRALLEAETTELVDVSTTVARKAGELRVEYGLKTWDAVHLATAIVAEVDVVVARDGRFPQGECEGVHVTGPFDIDEDKLFTPGVERRAAHLD